ncbi:hypothetical protein LCGC14_0441120 [marine sediment metagenome]|uniref:Uncharacterized protein n=1 Tax=marine sediment metagenome TaxID=412755 RepID=A0A0F9SK55_9ZZZZ
MEAGPGIREARPMDGPMGEAARTDEAMQLTAWMLEPAVWPPLILVGAIIYLGDRLFHSA